MTRAELRRTLQSTYGKRNYRITRNYEVHVYGIMPNTNIRGWWFLGYVGADNLVTPMCY